MIPVAKLIALFQKMYTEHWSYVWGKAEEGCVDCSGAFVYAYRQFGLSISHGSNAIARKYVSGTMIPILEAKPGMVAFKAKEPGEEGYDLPDKYKGSPDLSDYYHVGLVDDDPRYVLNAKGTKQGFCRDALTKKNGWDCVAYLKDVRYEDGGGEVSYQARVVGGGLNMRKTASTASEKLVQIPDGTLVHVTEESGEWAKTSYSGHTGWVLTKYLEKTGEDSDTVVVSRKVLESIYDKLGDVLGLRG